MKARVWVEQEVEVEVSAADVVAALGDISEPERLPMALGGISTCIGYLRRLPDALVAEMNDKQREIIVASLEEQAARYKTPNAKVSGVPPQD